jgi:hypothetical protein
MTTAWGSKVAECSHSAEIRRKLAPAGLQATLALAGPVQLAHFIFDCLGPGEL